MQATKSKTFTILLVDDREENLVSLEHLLEAENRVFLKARSGNEALKIALKTDNIGLILLDVQMPDMDGFEVAELLKSNARTKDISIIFVTAINKEQRHVLKGYDQGAVDYLQKPLDIDVTQSKVRVFEKLYFSQRDLKDTIEQKDKINKQLERFMFVVAHDLKSPLSGVLTMLELMQEDERICETEDLKEHMSLIIDASKHLSDMIGSILEYSRQNELEQSSEDVDTDVLVRQIAQLLFPPKNVTITIDGKLPVIKAKKLKLQQVFQNLISNAIKYNDKEHGEVHIGVEDDGEYCNFYVRDNGPGIVDGDKDRIFALFETSAVKARRESSTGVGLNVMKVLVEEQGGRIQLDSTPGNGSTFHFQWLKQIN